VVPSVTEAPKPKASFSGTHGRPGTTQLSYQLKSGSLVSAPATDGCMLSANSPPNPKMARPVAPSMIGTGSWRLMAICQKAYESNPSPARPTSSFPLSDSGVGRQSNVREIAPPNPTRSSGRSVVPVENWEANSSGVLNMLSSTLALNTLGMAKAMPRPSRVTAIELN
jgi:hypothetical protein